MFTSSLKGQIDTVSRVNEQFLNGTLLAHYRLFSAKKGEVERLKKICYKSSTSYLQVGKKVIVCAVDMAKTQKHENSELPEEEYSAANEQLIK